MRKPAFNPRLGDALQIVLSRFNLYEKLNESLINGILPNPAGVDSRHQSMINGSASLLPDPDYF